MFLEEHLWKTPVRGLGVIYFPLAFFVRLCPPHRHPVSFTLTGCEGLPVWSCSRRTATTRGWEARRARINFLCGRRSAAPYLRLCFFFWREFPWRWLPIGCGRRARLPGKPRCARSVAELRCLAWDCFFASRNMSSPGDGLRGATCCAWTSSTQLASPSC